MSDQKNVAGSSDSQTSVASCGKCSKDFKIVEVEKDLYKKLGLPDPVNCPSCRSEMRNMWRNKRELVKGKCGNCSKDIVTTPKFSPNVKIYCKDCYDKFTETEDNIIK